MFSFLSLNQISIKLHIFESEVKAAVEFQLVSNLSYPNTEGTCTSCGFLVKVSNARDV